MTHTLCPWPQASRPLLGTNGTEAMSVLLARGVNHLVDYLKVGPFMGREAVSALAPRYPLLLHLDDTLSGEAPLSEEHLADLREWIRLTGTPWISEHIGFNVPETDLRRALQPWPAEAGLGWERAMGNIVRNARALAEASPVPLLLENIPLFPNVAHWHVCEPRFIREVLARTGCGFLLDLAHARVSASLLGMEPTAYLEGLPLERVVEIHLSGPRAVRELPPERQRLLWENARTMAHVLSFGDDRLVDAHETLREEDYRLLEWALAHCRPQAISLEYYFEAEALQEQLERLGELLGR